MKKEKILTVKIAKELLASFLSKKESLPLPPLPSLPPFREDAPYISLGPPPPPLPEQESIEFEKKTKREMFLVHGVFASLRQSEREYIKCLPQFGWRISGTAMPDLTPFTQIETDAIGLLREAIVNGVNLWESPLLYEFLIEPLHLCMVEKLEMKSDSDSDEVWFSYQITFRSGEVWQAVFRWKNISRKIVAPMNTIAPLRKTRNFWAAKQAIEQGKIVCCWSV